jgi:PadR family transcriptional regulator PadR
MEPLSRVTPATLDVLAVLLAAGSSTWGLAVIKASGRPAGSVYPILDRLEKSGWVASEWADEPDRAGPRRRYYELTADGAQAARSLVTTRARAVIARVATA